MGIHIEDFSEEREAIAYLVRCRKRLWVYYLVPILGANFLVTGAPQYLLILASVVLVAIGAVHFDVLQGRIETRETWLSQKKNSSDLRACIELNSSALGETR